MTAGKILVVEDDADLGEMVRLTLESRSYQVYTATEGHAGLAAFFRHQPDLVVLDIMLPGLSGTELCREIRRQSNVPIIFISANRDVDDIIQGLDLGADDYVTKPFDPLVLLARVKANLRRAASMRPVTKLGKFEIDWQGREVLCDGSPVQLFTKERQLLFFLLEHPNQVFSAEQLYERVWGMPCNNGDPTVKVHISHLRKKIEEHPSEPKFIRTVRGYGYKLQMEE